MKHIGKCMEKIYILCGEIPYCKTSTFKGRKKAFHYMSKIGSYLVTFSELIRDPKLRKILGRLENSNDGNLIQQAQDIEELIRAFEYTLLTIETYLKQLRSTINGGHKRWRRTAEDMCLVIHEKFGDERGELRKEFSIAAHTESEVRAVVSSERHLAELLE